MPMDVEEKNIHYQMFCADDDKFFSKLGKERALKSLKKMIEIRMFEERGEQSYKMGKVWGFYHSYVGQEAIQVACAEAMGVENNLWITTYRCHALALLMGMSFKEGMCELYGKACGNVLGRGGSMHMYEKNMYGGFGIVGGQWPIGVGLAFSLKYRGIKDSVAICFGGDGSVAQGTFHESMNLAALWKLPIIFVVENNRFGMGTQVERAIAKQPIAESISSSYGIPGYTVNGMKFSDCYDMFAEAYKHVKENQSPVIVEALTYRFKGHSISDSASYRSREELSRNMDEDPIKEMCAMLSKYGYINDDELSEMKKEVKEKVLDAMKFADNSPDPDISCLGEGVIV